MQTQLGDLVSFDHNYFMVGPQYGNALDPTFVATSKPWGLQPSMEWLATTARRRTRRVWGVPG